MTKFAIKNKDGEIIVEFDRPQPFGETEFELSEEIDRKMRMGERLYRKFARADADCKGAHSSQKDKLRLKREKRLVEFQGYVAGVGEYSKFDLMHDDELALAALLAKWRRLAAIVYEAA